MKRLLFTILACASMVYAAPRNKPVVQPSVWNGYGDVDWCFASLRVGIANKDSLLEDGWALIDSLNLTYGEIDSLNVVNFGSDTVSVIYLFADTASISVATLDSIKSTLGDIDTLNTDSLHSILGSIDTLVVTSSLGDSLDFNIGLIDTLSSDSIHVESILATNNIDGNDVHVADSLYFATGDGINLTLTNNGVMNDLVVNDSASVTTALDTPNLVTFGGGNIENLANIFRFEPVTNKGYVQYNNSNHAFSIRQDSTIVAGNTNIDLNFIEEDNTVHCIQWYDVSGVFFTPETFRALHLWASTNLYLGGGGIGVATILTEPAGHYWASLCTVNNSYDGVLLDPNISGQDTVKVGVTGDNDIFVSECSENWFDADLKITDYSLTAGVAVTETVDARPVLMQWTGQITHEDFTAAATQEDVLVITNFPPKYKITSILVDVTQVFDDGAGAINSANMSFGPTTDPTSYLGFTDVYTIATQIGDSAGEVVYTPIQGGVTPSWTAATNLYARLKVTGGNTVDCTTGIADIYITYIAIE